MCLIPRNLAAARFNFKALYHAATIRGRRLQRSIRTRVNSFSIDMASVISLFVCTYNARAHTYFVVDPVPCGEISRRHLLGWVGWNMRRHFECGGISRCGEISRKYGSLFPLLEYCYYYPDNSSLVSEKLAMIFLRLSFTFGVSIIFFNSIPSEATNNFVFGECSPGKDSCRDCYISLAQHLFQSDENVFNLSEVFFPPDTNTPEFVVVRYHFQNTSYEKIQTWFWGASASYFLYPMATFQFLSLFFGKPEAFWTSEVDITLNATECEGVKQNHLKFLTQRVSHSCFKEFKDIDMHDCQQLVS